MRRGSQSPGCRELERKFGGKVGRDRRRHRKFRTVFFSQGENCCSKGRGMWVFEGERFQWRQKTTLEPLLIKERTTG